MLREVVHTQREGGEEEGEGEGEGEGGDEKELVKKVAAYFPGELYGGCGYVAEDTLK